MRDLEERKQQKPTAKRQAGRPRTPDEIRELILKIRSETKYGYTKIRQKLAKLGIRVSRQTVKNVLVAAGFGPEPDDGKDTWDAFLKRHAATLWQIDFITKPMWTVKGIVNLYLLVFLHLGTRQLWVSPCTAHPNAPWVTQQARNFLMHAEDLGLPARAERFPCCARGFCESVAPCASCCYQRCDSSALR